MRLIIAEWVRQIAVLAYSLMTDHAYRRLLEAEDALKKGAYKNVEGYLSQLNEVFDNKVDSYDKETELKNIYSKARDAFEMAYDSIKAVNKGGKSEMEEKALVRKVEIGIDTAKIAMKKAGDRLEIRGPGKTGLSG